MTYREDREERRDSLCFSHVRAVWPDEDEPLDPHDAADVITFEDQIAAPSGDAEECACDEDACACALDVLEPFMHREAAPVTWEPRDYTTLIVQPQEGDEMLPIASSSGTHRGVRCRRKS